MADRKELAVPEPVALREVEADWTETRKKFVIQNYCNGAPEAIAAVFIQNCIRRGLSPEAKQIYLIPRKTKNRDGQYETRWVEQTGIDGYRIIAERSGTYAGSDEPIFRYDERGALISATVTVWKFVQGQRCPFTSTAYLDEYDGKQGQWVTMKRTMLAKCAEALSLRKGHPENLSGLYTDAEMDQADAIDVSHTVRVHPAASAVLHAIDQSEPTDEEYITWREGIEAALDQADPSARKRDWGALVDAANGHEWRWIELILHAPNLQVLRAANLAAQKVGINSEELLRATEAREGNLAPVAVEAR